MASTHLTKRLIQELIRRAYTVPHTRVIERSRATHTVYQGINLNVTIVFLTTAVTTQGRDFWTEWIQIPELIDEIDSLQHKSHGEVVERIITTMVETPLKMFCSCPAFQYWGYRYITQMYASCLGRFTERRFPSVRNPNLEGVMCKHLTHCLYLLPLYAQSLSRDIREQRFLGDEYYASLQKELYV